MKKIYKSIPILSKINLYYLKIDYIFNSLAESYVVYVSLNHVNFNINI